MSAISGGRVAAAAAHRWLVMGASGAGKSTFARELSKILDLPTIHLDREFWKPGWVESGEEEWRRRVVELCAGGSWVMDGNFSGTLELRLPRAERVVLLDPSAWRCFVGIWMRALRHRGGTRPDMAPGCKEKIPDRQFMWWVLSYKHRSRPKVLRLVGRALHVTLHHLRSHSEARAFLDHLRRAG